MDLKFDSDPFNVTLHGIMSPDEYLSAITGANFALHSCRATAFDHALLYGGTAILPLIPWALRNASRKKERKRIMQKYVRQFNETNEQGLFMRWQTEPEKILTIWKKADAMAERAS